VKPTAFPITFQAGLQWPTPEPLPHQIWHSYINESLNLGKPKISLNSLGFGQSCHA